ncbi:MAG: hypothetical protein GWN93_26470 [Deltaproteobacteria bacterium]|nr:hypothetical protein [Deltaproteobacteria bacterium]
MARRPVYGYLPADPQVLIVQHRRRSRDGSQRPARADGCGSARAYERAGVVRGGVLGIDAQVERPCACRANIHPRRRDGARRRRLDAHPARVFSRKRTRLACVPADRANLYPGHRLPRRHRHIRELHRQRPAADAARGAEVVVVCIGRAATAAAHSAHHGRNRATCHTKGSS